MFYFVIALFFLIIFFNIQFCLKEISFYTIDLLQYKKKPALFRPKFKINCLNLTKNQKRCPAYTENRNKFSQVDKKNQKAVLWLLGVVFITTAQLHSLKPELRFCVGSNPAREVSRICDGEDI